MIERFRCARGEHVAVAACGGVVLVAAVMAVVDYAGTDGADAWSALRVIGLVVVTLVVVGGVGAAVSAVRMRTTHRPVDFHVHGAPLQLALDHERGHRVMAERIGGRVGECWVQTVPGRPDRVSHGMTRVWIPRDATPVQDAAVSYAGRAASGSSTGCGPDKDDARRIIARGVRFGQRGAAHAAAKRLADREVGRGVFGGSRVHGHVDIR